MSGDAIPEKLCKGSEFLSPNTHIMAGTDAVTMATVIKHLPLDVSLLHIIYILYNIYIYCFKILLYTHVFYFN